MDLEFAPHLYNIVTSFCNDQTLSNPNSLRTASMKIKSYAHPPYCDLYSHAPFYQPDKRACPNVTSLFVNSYLRYTTSSCIVSYSCHWDPKTEVNTRILYSDETDASLDASSQQFGLNFRTAPYFIMHAVQCV